MTRLPFDASRPCPKCGNAAQRDWGHDERKDTWLPPTLPATVKYVATSTLTLAEAARTEFTRDVGPDPHLLRTCNRCGYQWEEECIKELTFKGVPIMYDPDLPAESPETVMVETESLFKGRPIFVQAPKGQEKRFRKSFDSAFLRMVENDMCVWNKMAPKEEI